jgi:hypothetical protein
MQNKSLNFEIYKLIANPKSVLFRAVLFRAILSYLYIGYKVFGNYSKNFSSVSYFLAKLKFRK